MSKPIFQHKTLAQGRWQNMSFLEQMANIGSEVERTISWKEKENQEYSDQAFIRSLELFDLTLDTKHSFSRIKEIARAREMWVDFVRYGNSYNSTKESWRKYFIQLLMAYKLQE